MTEAPTISGPEFPPASGGPAKQLVVLLHGWGADGQDLIGLAPYFAQLLPEAAFVSPHAPFPCDLGMGRQWFSLDDRRPEGLMAGVRVAAPIIDRFIDAELARRGLDDGDLALVGFSQGTMMCLYVAPRRAHACAALLGYSGALMGPELLAAETRSRPPVMLVHGMDDPIVSAAALPQAREALTAAGFEVEALLRPGLGHGIDEAGLQEGGAFLQRALTDKASTGT